jgi:hypothetical protein
MEETQTKQGIRRLVWPIVRVTAVLLALAHFIIGGVQLAKEFGHSDSDMIIGGDFAVYYAAGEAALEGVASQAYDRERFLQREQKFAGKKLTQLDWHYPPSMFFLVLPTQFFDFLNAKIVWAAMGMVFLFVALRSVFPGHLWLVLLILISPSAIHNIYAGQNGLIIAAIAVLGLANIKRRPIFAGVVIGLLTVKPHLGVMIPLALIAGGHWRVFAVAAATSVFLFVSSALFFGFDSWLAFISNSLQGANLAAEGMRALWFKMPTVYAGARQLGLPSDGAWIAQALATLFVAIVIIKTWSSEGDQRWKVSLLLLSTTLIIPYAQFYDLVMIMPAYAWALLALGHVRFPQLSEGLIILAYLSPAFLLLPMHESHTVFVWAGLFLLLFILCWREYLHPRLIRG